MQLADKDRDVLKLIMRSPDRGEGWRSVSNACWPLVESFVSDELLESKKNEDGTGMVRLSDRGSVLCDYL